MTKTCWIIGASHGIGEELAFQFFKKGYNLIISSRFQKDLELLASKLDSGFSPNSTKSSCGNSQNWIKIIPFDVSNLDSLMSAWERIDENLESRPVIDITIFAAGIYQEMSVRDFDIGVSKKIIEVNLGGFLNFLNLVSKNLDSGFFKNIAAISSVAGYFGMPKSCAYGASKAAMINLCEGIYPELKSANINLSVINPGFVKTRLTDQNKFQMPFLISTEEAAEEIIKGLEAKNFEIHFPKKFTFLLKIIQLLPYRLLLPILQKIYLQSTKS